VPFVIPNMSVQPVNFRYYADWRVC